MVSESDVTVQGHGVHTAYMELASALERRDDVALIRNEFWEKIDCDIIHLHTIGAMTWRKLLQRGPKKVISTHVVPDSFVGSLRFARAWRPLAIWYMRWFYNRADMLLATSQETEKDLRAIGVKSPITVAYNSIDTHKYQNINKKITANVRKKLRIPPDAFVVIGAGQVQPRKRLDCFVKAAETMQDVYFLWVGGMPFGKLGANSGAMEELIRTAPKNLIFTGAVPLEVMPHYYAMANLFWLPSDQETFGMVIVEAAAAGLPVLVRDLEDYDDTFDDNVIRATDDSFVEAIKTVMSDKKVYVQWQRKSARIAKRFDSLAATERLVKLYRQMLY